MKPKLHPITIIQDTREQRPLDFSPFPSVSVEVAKLWPGDYSVKGYEKSIAFERKSVADLIGTLKNGYAGRHALRRLRFDYELEEFERHYDRVFLVVEPDEGGLKTFSATCQRSPRSTSGAARVDFRLLSRASLIWCARWRVMRCRVRLWTFEVKEPNVVSCPSCMR